MADSTSSMPSPRRTSPSASPSGAGSRPSRWSAMSTITASPPSRRTACAISTPTGPPPRISSRRGTAVIAVASRLVQTPSSSRSPGIGGITGSAPLARTTWSAVWRTPSTSTTPRPASRPVPRSRSMPLSASHCAAPASVWSETMKSRHAKRRLDVDLGGRRRVARAVDRLAGPQQRLGRDARPVRALAPDELALDDRDAQAALGQCTRAVFARRARAEHDHVVVAAHVGSSSPARSRTM